MNFFYHKLIQIDDLKNIIEREEFAVEQKQELIIMVKDTLHHRVVETVLTHLPQEHHQEFLETFAEKPHDEGILGFLKEKAEDIEDKIRDAVERVKNEILTDLQSEE